MQLIPPWCVRWLRRYASVKEVDDLCREAGEIDQNALLVLQALEVLLADFERVKEREVCFT